MEVGVPAALPAELVLKQELCIILVTIRQFRVLAVAPAQVNPVPSAVLQIAPALPMEVGARVPALPVPKHGLLRITAAEQMPVV